MTVSSETDSVSYVLPSIVTPLPVTFRFLEDGDLRVVYAPVSGATPTALTLNTDYTVTGARTQGGGTVTLLIATSAGDTVSIDRGNMPRTQLIDYRANDPFPEEDAEDGLDRLTMLLQQAGIDGGRRSLTLFPTDPTTGGRYNANLNRIVSLADGEDPSDAATLQQVISAGSGNFIQGGTGAIVRTVQNELRDTLSAKQFGFSEDASASDNATFLGLAIDQAIALGLSGVRIPAGFYSVGATITKAISEIRGFTLYGDGADVTEICFTQANGNGFNLTMGNDNWYADVDNHNAIHFADLTICSTADNAGTLVYIDGGSKEGQTKPPVFFSRVVLRSANLDKNPAKLVHLHDCGNANFSDVIFNAARVISVNNGGDGLTITATDATTDPTSYMLSHCRFLGNQGIVAGDYAEGIYATQCEFLSRKALVWNAPGGGESGLHVLGGHINFVDGGIECSGIFHAHIQGVLFFRQNTTTNNAKYVSMSGGASIAITDNNFVGANGTGEELIRIDNVPDSAGNGVLIESNQFSNTATAVKLTNTARRVQVGVSNQFLNCFAKITDDSAGANRNYIGKRRYTGSIVPTLTGGSATETLDVAIPAGIFDAKPTSAILVGSGNNMIGYYDYDSASSTSTNARFLLRPLSGNVPAGLARFSFAADE